MNSKIVQKHHHPHIIHHLPSTTNHHTWRKVGILPSIPKSFKAYHLPRSFRLGLDEPRFKEASVSITKAPVFEKTEWATSCWKLEWVAEGWNSNSFLFFSSPRDTGLNFWISGTWRNQSTSSSWSKRVFVLNGSGLIYNVFESLVT